MPNFSPRSSETYPTALRNSPHETCKQKKHVNPIAHTRGIKNKLTFVDPAALDRAKTTSTAAGVNACPTSPLSVHILRKFARLKPTVRCADGSSRRRACSAAAAAAAPSASVRSALIVERPRSITS